MVQRSSAPEPYFINLKRAAQILQVSERTLYKYIKNGCGPPVKYLGPPGGKKRRMRMRFSEFIEWATARNHPDV